jgi:putative redox protein
MSPYEFLMAGLGSCTAMTLRMYATRKRWPLDKVVVEVTHEKATTADGNRIDRFERAIRLAGELTEEQLERLMAVAEQCPVGQTLRRPSLVVSRLSSSHENSESQTDGGLRTDQVSVATV